MNAEAVALDNQHRPAKASGHPLGDREIADRTQHALAELQDARQEIESRLADRPTGEGGLLEKWTPRMPDPDDADSP